MFRIFGGRPAWPLGSSEGMLPGLSVNAVPIKSSRRPDGVVVRERVHLDAVGLCEEPAYAGALVTMRRSRVELQLPERPPDAQVARLLAIGIVIEGR